MPAEQPALRDTSARAVPAVDVARPASCARRRIRAAAPRSRTTRISCMSPGHRDGRDARNARTARHFSQRPRDGRTECSEMHGETDDPPRAAPPTPRATQSARSRARIGADRACFPSMRRSPARRGRVGCTRAAPGARDHGPIGVGCTARAARRGRVGMLRGAARHGRGRMHRGRRRARAGCGPRTRRRRAARRRSSPTRVRAEVGDEVGDLVRLDQPAEQRLRAVLAHELRLGLVPREVVADQLADEASRRPPCASGRRSRR